MIAQTSIIDEPIVPHRHRSLGYDNWDVKEEPRYEYVVVKGWSMK